jgi:hypothetical protein
MIDRCDAVLACVADTAGVPCLIPRFLESESATTIGTGAPRCPSRPEWPAPRAARSRHVVVAVAWCAVAHVDDLALWLHEQR